MILGSTIYNWGLLWTYHSQLLNGLLVALEVAVTGLVLSVFGGLLLAVWRMAGPPFSLPATLYINVFRGIPALVSVIWVYFGWSLVLGIKLSVYEAAVTALALLYSAYLAEIFRAALTAVPRGQREAGLALGLKRWQVFFRVTIPQAARIALPNIGSMLIGMVKDTSTFMVIGLVEVVYVSESIVSTTSSHLSSTRRRRRCTSSWPSPLTSPSGYSSRRSEAGPLGEWRFFDRETTEAAHRIGAGRDGY